jgi:tetratricopeptide (TPR) repeat protein
MKRRSRHHHHLLSCACALFALAVCLSFVSRAAAEDGTPDSPVSLAERRAGEAFDAYGKGDYNSAVALYLEAYNAAPSGAALYNIARIYDTKLADRPLAISFYRRYIAHPGANTAQIVIASQRLQALNEAEFAAQRAQTDNAPSPSQKQAQARAGPRSAPETASGTHNGWSTLRWTGLVVGALGVVGVGVGAGFGLAAMSHANTAHDSCTGNDCTSQHGVDAAHSAHDDATISNLGFATGGALLVTGAAFILLGSDKPATQTATVSTTSVRCEPQLSASGLSLAVAFNW